MENNPSETVDLLERAKAGDPQALNEIFTRHRDRLRRMVEMRLDWRLQARIDASDVIQDAYLEASGRMEEYLRDPKLPLFLWLRLVVGEQLINLHRHHLGAQMRDAGRRRQTLHPRPQATQGRSRRHARWTGMPLRARAEISCAKTTVGCHAFADRAKEQ